MRPEEESYYNDYNNSQLYNLQSLAYPTARLGVALLHITEVSTSPIVFDVLVATAGVYSADYLAHLDDRTFHIPLP